MKNILNWFHKKTDEVAAPKAPKRPEREYWVEDYMGNVWSEYASTAAEALEKGRRFVKQNGTAYDVRGYLQTGPMDRYKVTLYPPIKAYLAPVPH